MTLWHIETSSRCHLSSVKTWSREPLGQNLDERSSESRSEVGSNPQTSCRWWQLHHSAVCFQGGQCDHREVCAWGLWRYHQGLSRSGDAVPHTPRGLVAGRVRLPPEVELSTCRGCTGWNAYYNQMSTRGRQPLPQLQGLPLHCTLGPGGWRLQVPVGGHGGSRVNFRCSDFQAHRFEAQNTGWQHRLPWQWISWDWWTKGELIHPRGWRLPTQALANEALLQPHYGLEDGLQL